MTKKTIQENQTLIAFWDKAFALSEEDQKQPVSRNLSSLYSCGQGQKCQKVSGYLQKRIFPHSESALSGDRQFCSRQTGQKYELGTLDRVQTIRER